MWPHLHLTHYYTIIDVIAHESLSFTVDATRVTIIDALVLDIHADTSTFVHFYPHVFLIHIFVISHVIYADFVGFAHYYIDFVCFAHYYIDFDETNDGFIEYSIADSAGADADYGLCGVIVFANIPNITFDAAPKTNADAASSIIIAKADRCVIGDFRPADKAGSWIWW